MNCCRIGKKSVVLDQDLCSVVACVCVCVRVCGEVHWEEKRAKRRDGGKARPLCHFWFHRIRKIQARFAQPSLAKFRAKAYLGADKRGSRGAPPWTWLDLALRHCFLSCGVGWQQMTPGMAPYDK